MAGAIALSMLLHALILLADPGLLGDALWASSATKDRGEPRLLAQLAPPSVSSNSGAPSEEPVNTGSVSASSLVNAPETDSPAAAPRFFDANTLDKRPRATTDQIPGESEFSLIASTGTIRLRLWIDEHGDVVHVTIERGDLPLEFGAQLASAFRGLRFEPGERQGRAVGSILNVEVTYADSRKSSS